MPAGAGLSRGCSQRAAEPGVGEASAGAGLVGHGQRENHKRNLVRVWIEFMFTAEENRNRELTFLSGLRCSQGNSNRCATTFSRMIVFQRKWVTYLKSLLGQCCLQTGSWYSNSSNIIGLQFVEEPS